MEFWFGLLAAGLSVGLGLAAGFVTRELVVGLVCGVVVFAIVAFVPGQSAKTVSKQPFRREKRGKGIQERQSNVGGHTTRAIERQTVRIAGAREESERPEEASADHQRATEIQPEKSEASHAKGEALYDLQRYEEALQSLEEVIRLKPHDPDVWYLKGLCLLELDRSDEAKAALTKAVRLRRRT